MLHFDNCKTLGKHYNGKPKDIIIGGTIINIDYTYDYMYWINRFEKKLFCMATDTTGIRYKIYTNRERNLATAIPEQ